jgi:hypothetical protein
LEFRGAPQIFLEEFRSILRKPLGTPIFVPWLQGLVIQKMFKFSETSKSSSKVEQLNFPLDWIGENDQKMKSLRS